MNYLNNKSEVAFSQSLTSTNPPYSYPNRDFCIFAKIPMNISINLYLDEPNVITFTYVWLCKVGNMKMNVQPCNQTINWTMIDEMLKLCKIKNNRILQNSSGVKYYPLYTDWYQTRLIRILFIEIVPFILIPCACLIGLFFNWKIIQTINKNEKKDLKEDFYKYMSANVKFNSLYCLIFVFYPMNSCIWRLYTTFCSSIFTSLFVQYFKIVA
jgi:hypothetical protein